MAESIAADPWYMNPHRSNERAMSFDLMNRACQTAASVVSVCVHRGGTQILYGSGFVVESITIHRKFVSTVLTSASLIRSRDYHIAALASDIEVIKIVSDEITSEGVISAYDFNFNIAVIKIETDGPITPAILRKVNTAVSINPYLDANLPEFDTQSGKYNLRGGDTVVALGRYHGLIAVAGNFNSQSCYDDEIGLDCQELLRADLIFPTDGIGGPLINRYGEVIGMNFHHASFTPFLPINIVSMCWEQLEKNGHCLLPRLGLKLFNVSDGTVAYMETFLQRSPETFKGVAVRVIRSDAPVFSPEILRFDVIVGCDGIPIGSILELFEAVCYKVGQAVHLDVVRYSDGSHVKLTVVVGNIGQEVVRWRVAWPRRKRLRGTTRN